jgi:hypothetical protein
MQRAAVAVLVFACRNVASLMMVLGSLSSDRPIVAVY